MGTKLLREEQHESWEMCPGFVALQLMLHPLPSSSHSMFFQKTLIGISPTYEKEMWGGGLEA